MNKMRNKFKLLFDKNRGVKNAFTVAELLIVIVAIAILAAVTIVAYRGITKQTTESTMKGSLSAAYQTLDKFIINNSQYPSTMDCSKAESSTNFCINNTNNDISYTYTPGASLKTYKLCATSASWGETYCVTNSKSVATLQTGTQTETCPSGFILVPGSETYGTDDFCVMKYEAKIYGNDSGDQTYSSSNIPSSRASGTPYVNISQTNAITQAQKTVDQSGNIVDGAHLITEAEWMTIAQNVLGVASNWSGSAVGSGFIYNGHVNDSDYSDNSLTASSDDNNSNYGEPSYDNSNVNDNNKRTLTLSNGQIIWDLSGNVSEWTDEQITGGQPGVVYSDSDPDSWDYTFYEWNYGNLSQGAFPSSSMPSSMAFDSLSPVTDWTSSNGIGMLCSYFDETATKGFLRGGFVISQNQAGVLALNLIDGPSSEYFMIGFRVAAPPSL